MPVRPLPSQPNLDHLKHQAKDLLREHRARNPTTAQRLREFHPRFGGVSDGEIFSATLALSDAQLAIAREHGFPSWTRLKRRVEAPVAADRLDLPHHERIEDALFRRAVELIDRGDGTGLGELLTRHSELVKQRVVFEGGNYFRTPSLLEFVAENPVRRGRLPENIVDVARVILDRDPEVAARNETLMLVATGSVARACGVQKALIGLLCAYGADADEAARAAALHGEREALEALLGRGAAVDLPLAAALGRLEEFERLLPGASAAERHLALALSIQYGHVEVVRRLLDAGEDPNRFNPVGGHSHGTPLHHAAGEGNEAMVWLLLERGARVDVKDVLWHATPVEWAEHEGKSEVARLLREWTPVRPKRGE